MLFCDGKTGHVDKKRYFDDLDHYAYYSMMRGAEECGKVNLTADRTHLITLQRLRQPAIDKEMNYSSLY